MKYEQQAIKVELIKSALSRYFFLTKRKLTKLYVVSRRNYIKFGGKKKV